MRGQNLKNASNFAAFVELIANKKDLSYKDNVDWKMHFSLLSAMSLHPWCSLNIPKAAGNEGVRIRPSAVSQLKKWSTSGLLPTPG